MVCVGAFVCVVLFLICGVVVCCHIAVRKRVCDGQRAHVCMCCMHVRKRGKHARITVCVFLCVVCVRPHGGRLTHVPGSINLLQKLRVLHVGV